MSTQFSSNNPTSYFGILPTNPGQNWFRNRNPLPSDFKNYSLGDRWIHVDPFVPGSASIWALVAKSATAGTWAPLGGGSVAVEDITPDAGGDIFPNFGNVIVTGDSAKGVSTLNSGASTLQITISDATTAQKGVISLATNAEAITGTNTTKAMTSDDVSAKLGPMTANSLLIGQGLGSAFTSVGPGTAGQALISSGAAVDPQFTSNLVVGATGIVTTVNQSGMSAYKSADSTNQTGDLTAVKLVYDSEDYDIRGEYDNLTGVFTATDAGLYQINLVVLLKNLTAAHNVGNIQIYKGLTLWWQYQFNPGASMDSASQYSAVGCAILQLAAGDTVTTYVQIGGSTKTITIGGATNVHTQMQISKIA